MTIALIGLNASIFMKNRNIQKIAQLLCNHMGNSGSHNFSAITNYQLLKYTKRTLYNIPIGVKYFYFEMNMHMLRLNYLQLSYLDEHDMRVL